MQPADPRSTDMGRLGMGNLGAPAGRNAMAKASKAMRAMAAITALVALAAANGFSQSADSLPAFKPDSAVQDPFRKVEAGPSPWSANPTASPQDKRDSGAAPDTVTDRLRKRLPAVSVYLGVDFMDFDAKNAFQASLDFRRSQDSLTLLQEYEPVHLAFPIGIQAAIPISGYLDVVAKTHFYWYKQTAVLGDQASNHVGDEFYAVQANLAGLGLRFYIPPAFLSVTGGLGLYTQALLYWNAGNTGIYSNHGSAEAEFDAWGSGYEFQFGMQQALKGPWRLTGAIGFLQQDFTSEQPWSGVIGYAPPPGKAHWGSSSIQATLNLWYHFGVESQAPKTPAAPLSPGPVPPAAPATDSSGVPATLPPAAPEAAPKAVPVPAPASAP
jgi:hypothetical protein